MKIVLFVLILSFFPSQNAKATQEREQKREYILSHLTSLLHSYSTVDFTRDSEEEIDPLKYNCAIKMNEFNREQASVLKNLFSEFKNEKMSADDLLRRLLDIRFQNINFFQRHKGFPLAKKENLLGNNIKGGGNITIIAPNIKIGNEIDLAEDYVKFIEINKGKSTLRFISKKEEEIYKLFDKYIPVYESSEQIDVRESFTSLANDNIYVLTQMILGVYSLRPPSYFSDDTYDFIRASHSLWPLLEQVGKGADPFLLDDEENLFENKELLKEYESYAMCLLNVSAKKIRLMGLGCTDRDTVKVYGVYEPLKDSGLIEGKWSLLDLPMTLQELRKQKSTVKKKRKKKASQQAPSKKLPEENNAIPLLGQNQLISDQPASPSEILTENNPKPIIDEPETLQDDEIVEEDALGETNLSTASVPNENETSSSTYEHMFSSWNRKFHSKRNLQAIPIRTDPIPTPHLKVLRAIFGNTSKISYHAFESLWLHLNGEKSIKPSRKKGTSHRRLLNSDGKVVGGTFALNGKRQYSSDHLSELQDALTLIGYGQNYLSLVQ